MCFSNKYFVWSGSVELVAHGTGTVGSVDGVALGRAVELVWLYFLLGESTKEDWGPPKLTCMSGGPQPPRGIVC